MAQKRMLSKKVTDDDKFINLSESAQALYLHLVMSADDDGFTNQLKLCKYKAHADDHDYEELKAGQFIIEFKDGVIVIRHWLMMNTLQNDRYHETDFTDDKKALKIEKGKPYEVMDTTCIQNVYRMETEHNLTKHNLTKQKDITSGNPDNAPPDDSGNKSDPEKRPAYSAEVNEVIDYLNQKAGTHYRYVDSNNRLIISRLKAGYSVEDFKTVIDKKCDEWIHDPKMKAYIRPETLFRQDHFESYLNQTVTPDQHGNASSGMHNTQAVRLPEYVVNGSADQEGTPAKQATIEAIKKMQEKMSDKD